MTELSEKIGYIRGLIGSLELDADSANAKLLSGIADVLEGMLSQMREMSEDLGELNDFVESIDEDLEDLEAMHDESEGGLGFFDEDDEDFEDLDYASPEEGLRVLQPHAEEEDGPEALAGSICTECNQMFFVPIDEGEDPEDVHCICPHCKKEVPLKLLEPGNTPIAKRVKEDS